MSKKTATVICIVMALLSFLGGVLYRYNDYAPIVEELQEKNESLQSQLDAFYRVPVDIDLTYRWLKWATEQYQYRIDNKLFKEHPLEFYRSGIDMFSKIRDIVKEFEEEYYKNE